jgi:hypothetical protein
VQRRFHVKTVGAVKGEQSELAEVERPRSLQDTLNSLTSSIWNKMDKAQKSEIWQFVGLTAAGKNLDVCREDSTLKEGNPMVGACSYGDHCTVKTPTARWPYVCAQPRCKFTKFTVDLMCCARTQR